MVENADWSEDVGALDAAGRGYQALSAPIQRRDGVRHGNVVLTRLPVVSHRRICLDYERHEPRTALEVWLETGARPLRVVATHLGLRPGEGAFRCGSFSITSLAMSSR